MVLLLSLCAMFVHCATGHVTHDLNNVWTKRELHSPLAKEIALHQSKCTSPTHNNTRRTNGMGSELHVWSQALCNSMQVGKTLVQVDQPWQWNDPALCNATESSEHKQPLSCYFNVRSECPPHPEDGAVSFGNRFDNCPKYIQDLPSRTAFRSAAMEYLFSNLNPALVDEARKAIVDVFGETGIPADLFTVHIRWGDKRTEMNLVSPIEYYQAISAFVVAHAIPKPHIYISSEDPNAVSMLQAEITRHNQTWTLHHFAPLIATHTQTQANRGPSGKNSLIALLLAMEAKYYILTTGSNWSRLMNELRMNVVDVACGNCTAMVDLRQAYKYQDWRV